jgi:SAM-dependent methyltransferase
VQPTQLDEKEEANRRSAKLYGEEYSKYYRLADNKEATSEYYKDLAERLQKFSASFGRPVTVVDFGCGTGRYFHALQNVQRLYGIDISPFMLAEARNPVKSAAGVKDMVLLQGGVDRLAELPPGSVDFVYSVGVLAEHCVLDVELCDTVHRVLRDGGLFYFSVADKANRRLRPRSMKRRVLELAFPLLPKRVRVFLARRWLDLSLSRADLERIFSASAFGCGLVESETLLPSSWTGRHFYCTLRK